MQKGGPKVLLITGGFSLLCWAIDKLAAGVDWLPLAVVPLSVGSIAAGGAWWLFDYAKARGRPALRGVGVHATLQINQGRLGRRRYILEWGRPAAPGLALFVSASERLTFELRDARGEPHTLQADMGRNGVPWAERVYLGAEVGLTRGKTVMRLILDGRILAERTLPFAVEFLRPDLNRLTFGANDEGGQHGAFAVNNLQLVDRTLSDREAREMARWQARRAEAGRPVVAFGEDGRPTSLVTGGGRET